MLRRWRREAVEEAERGGGVERQSVQWVDFLPLVSSAISCFENSEGLRPRICLPCCRKASSSCSIRSRIGGLYSLGHILKWIEVYTIINFLSHSNKFIEQILHGLVGLVRSPITATVPQISSRLFVTWGVLWSFPETRTHLLVSLLVISWSITEVSMHTIHKSNEKLPSDPYPICSQGQSDPGAINQSCISGTTPMEMGLWVGESGLGPLGFSNICRSIQIIRYSFFGSKEAFGFAPSWIMWLRYSTFLFLYPIGISSEVGLIYFALPYIKESGKYSIRLPNKLNFSLDSFYIAILVLGIYFPGSSHMYTYMIGQRTRALSKLKKV
ncbi:hypothetical protein RHGRI_030098 [Rhododendron griersonianum]|uniref:Very-long-chain (3R)-3-hydroxyacyl-CoA dehydratase n=1 Tax=Rhododendron griersonianum TaxID=479676 RepID=A0AAV6ISL2_9ERIC|nr:hypothetical protein RHGRI_030098 [Rhododendron griersonianum]